jgi:hypothetical protein
MAAVIFGAMQTDHQAPIRAIVGVGLTCTMLAVHALLPGTNRKESGKDGARKHLPTNAAND